jgi:hypothetical protein
MVSSARRSPAFYRSPKQDVRLSHQNVQKQTEQACNEEARDKDDALVKVADLLLSSDDAPLELQGLVGHTPVLGEVLALSVADLLEQTVGTVVGFHRSPCRQSLPDVSGRTRA